MIQSLFQPFFNLSIPYVIILNSLQNCHLLISIAKQVRVHYTWILYVLVLHIHFNYLLELINYYSISNSLTRIYCINNSLYFFLTLICMILLTLTDVWFSDYLMILADITVLLWWKNTRYSPSNNESIKKNSEKF